ncbi:MAG: hypothetical protein ABIQ73_13440 [Acidimicrobiales bacterium]
MPKPTIRRRKILALVAFLAIVLAVVVAADDAVEGQDASDAVPFGFVDRVDVDFATRTVVVQGWAIDRQTADPIAVHVYVNGVLRSGVLADRSRLDVGAAYPSFGDRHGYALSVAADAGANVVCVYGINVGVGTNSLIGCRVVTIDDAPFGSVDRVDVEAGLRSVVVHGWALDVQTADPIAVHVYVNGVLRGGGTADRSRADVAAVYPLFGDRHGFAVSVPARAGINVVCVYGINVGVGANRLIGCRDVSVGGSNGLEGVMPGAMIVAHYGSGFDARLGVLGTQPPFAAAAAVRERALQWTRFGLPVVPAFNYIASIATSGAGPDGDYSTPSDLATLRSWLDGIRSVGGIMVIDIQPGRSDFVSELRRYESLLLEPDVHVALDPEWRMGPGEVPGTIIGSVGVDEVNAATQYLADLVRVHQLPRKIVVLHQFTPFMIRERERLAARDELHVTIQLDGFGSPEAKLSKYRELHAVAPFYSGFKLFLQQDTRLMDPTEVRALDPPATWVSYQ